VKLNRGYQNDFSSLHGNNVYNVAGRERKAITTLSVLKNYFSKCNLSQMALLDVGASSGIIGNYLSQHFAEVTGIDIDTTAIEYANKNFSSDNLNFHVGDAMSLNFSENTFDVVLCSHVYEHVPDPERMMNQIFRVLKPGGVCFFSAGNRLAIEEPHYNLLFLSVMPRLFSHLYLRLAGKGNYYYEKHLSYWGLKRLVTKFDVVDYTSKVINSPEDFAIDYMLQPGSRKHRFAQFIVRRLYWLCPGYLWLLKKP